MIAQPQSSHMGGANNGQAHPSTPLHEPELAAHRMAESLLGGLEHVLVNGERHPGLTWGERIEISQSLEGSITIRASTLVDMAYDRWSTDSIAIPAEASNPGQTASGLIRTLEGSSEHALEVLQRAFDGARLSTDNHKDGESETLQLPPAPSHPADLHPGGVRVTEE